MTGPDPVLDRLGAAYDLDGQPMSLREWAFEFENRAVGRGIVAQTYLPNGYYISTVWLGIPALSLGRRPLIYESMVFLDWGSRTDLDCVRYATEATAVAGHEQLVHRWRQKKRRKHGARA